VPVEGGVRLDFVTEEICTLTGILRGLMEPPSEASAAAAMQIQLGDVYRKEKLDAAVFAPAGILHEEGLYQAKVTTEVQASAETHQIDVIAHVTPGARARCFGGAIDEQHGISGCTDYGTAEDEGGNGDYEWANPKRDRAHPKIPGEEGPFERTGGGEARGV